MSRRVRSITIALLTLTTAAANPARPTDRFRTNQGIISFRESFSVTTAPVLVLVENSLQLEEIPGWKVRDKRAIAAAVADLELARYEQENEPELQAEQADVRLRLAILKQFPSGIPNRRGDDFDREKLHEAAMDAVDALSSLSDEVPSESVLHRLASAHFLAGRALLRGPEPPEHPEVGLEHFDGALTLWRALSDEHEENRGYAQLVAQHSRLVAAWKVKLNDIEGAIEAIEKSGNSLSRLAGHFDPAFARSSQTGRHRALAWLLSQAGRDLEAANQLEIVVRLQVEVWQKDRDNTNQALRILRTAAHLASIGSERFDVQGLRKAMTPIVRHLEDSSSVQRAWIGVLTQLAINLEDGDDIERALSLYKEVIKVKQRINNADETVETERNAYDLQVGDDTLTTIVIMRDLQAVAQLQEAVGDTAQALATYRYAISQWETLTKKDPNLKQSLPSAPETLLVVPLEKRRPVAATLQAATKPFTPLPPSVDAFRSAAAEIYVAYAKLILAKSPPQADKAVRAAETACMLTHYNESNAIAALKEAYAVHRDPDSVAEHAPSR